MGEAVETILRVAVIIGLALFCWSVASSLEKIAAALTRLADDRKGADPPGGDRQPRTTPPGP
jgi:hypothetical protein